MPGAARERDAILRLETMLMSGQDIGPYLDMCLPEQLDASSLLLKKRGEQLMAAGRLAESKAALEKAVRGFVGQGSSELALSAMSWLARVLLRMGLTAEAKTLLAFIYEDVRRNPSTQDGYLFLALAQGAHLLGNEDGSPTDGYYDLAMRCFAGEGDAAGLITTGFDQLRKTYFCWDSVKWHERLHSFLCTTECYPASNPYGLLLQAMDDFFCRRWEKALEAADEVLVANPPDKLPDLLAQGLRLMAMSISRKKAPDTKQAIASFYTPIAQAVDMDLESRWVRESTRYVYLIVCEEQDAAAISAVRLNTLIEMGLPPEYRAQMERLKQLAAAERSDDARSTAQSVDARPATASSAAMQPADARPAATAALPTLEPPGSGEAGKWRIECFRGLKFVRQNREISHIQWKRRKTLELLLFLLLKPQYKAPKEWIIEALFGDSDPQKSAGQLYVAVHQLKKVIGEHFGISQGVVVQAGTIRLNEHFIQYVDVEKYMTLVRVGHQLWSKERELSCELYAEAVQMYGDMLPEMQYIEWLEPYREQMSLYQATMLGRLTEQASSRGQLEDALHYGLQYVEHGPLQEEAYQALLAILVKMGRKAEAKEWYDKFERVCQAELGVAPMLETRSIVHGPPAHSGHNGSTGREGR